MSRTTHTAVAILTTVALAAPMTTAAFAANHAPNVRCRQLDRAERSLHRAGFSIREKGGGFFGIVVKADWVVVHQSQRGNVVTLTAGRSC